MMKLFNTVVFEGGFFHRSNAVMYTCSLGGSTMSNKIIQNLIRLTVLRMAYYTAIYMLLLKIFLKCSSYGEYVPLPLKC